MWPQPESFYFSPLVLISLFYKNFLSPAPFLSPLNGDHPLLEVLFFLKKKSVFASPNCLLFERVKVTQSCLTLCHPMGYPWLTCWSTEVRTHHPVLGSGTFPGKRPGRRRGGRLYVRWGNSPQRALACVFQTHRLRSRAKRGQGVARLEKDPGARASGIGPPSWHSEYGGMMLNRAVSWPGLCVVAQMVKNLSAVQETQVWPLGWEDPLEKGMATYSIFWPGESHGQRSLARNIPSIGSQSVRRNWVTNALS